MTEHIITETRDRVQRIELHRPDKKNAITVAMYEAMAAALARAGADPAVRVILIHTEQPSASPCSISALARRAR